MLPLIIGASVGGCCCLLLTILLIVWLVRRRRGAAKSETNQEYFQQEQGGTELIKRGSQDDGTLVLSNSTSDLTMNRQQIYASAPQIDPPATKEYGTSTLTRGIVYDAAPPLPTQQIYGAAPPVALNASGGEYGAAPPEATSYGGMPPVSYGGMPPDSYGGMPATATSTLGRNMNTNTTYYGRIGRADSEDSADTSRSSV
jgi:hypothetical protein